ncbi:MAG: thioredoxin fold domain-containing protein [Magnetococcus sp. DMHC-1]|nr:thioredoxin fold domain-containing protein [Magnetococcales bacterium]
MQKIVTVTGKLFILLLALLTARDIPALETEIIGRVVVFVNDGCPYCRTFEQEVGQAYPKTALGQRFPMVKVDTFDPPKEYATLAKEVCFTPTILVLDRQGVEQARFRGYRGNEFFWADMEAVAQKMGFVTKTQKP